MFILHGLGSSGKTQLAIEFQNLPDLGSSLKIALETEPAISKKTLKEQFERLIFGPLSELPHPAKTFIVIDD